MGTETGGAWGEVPGEVGETREAGAQQLAMQWYSGMVVILTNHAPVTDLAAVWGASWCICGNASHLLGLSDAFPLSFLFARSWFPKWHLCLVFKPATATSSLETHTGHIVWGVGLLDEFLVQSQKDYFHVPGVQLGKQNDNSSHASCRHLQLSARGSWPYQPSASRFPSEVPLSLWSRAWIRKCKCIEIRNSFEGWYQSCNHSFPGEVPPASLCQMKLDVTDVTAALYTKDWVRVASAAFDVNVMAATDGKARPPCRKDLGVLSCRNVPHWFQLTTLASASVDFWRSNEPLEF